MHVSPQDPNELARARMRSSARLLLKLVAPDEAARPSLRCDKKNAIEYIFFFCAIESSLGLRDMNLSHVFVDAFTVPPHSRHTPMKSFSGASHAGVELDELGGSFE